MKFLFALVLLVFTTSIFCQRGNATTGPPVCETTSKSEPTNIHVHCSAQGKGEKGDKGDKGTPCDCGLQSVDKPSVHLEPLDLRLKTYRANQVIQDWSLTSPSSHLAGGMTYTNGKVTVPMSGRYYIYAQMYMRNNHNRIFIMVNNKVVTMIQPMIQVTSDGTVFTAGVFKLNASDLVMLKVAMQGPIQVYMSWRHCYFGAYLI